MTSIYIKWQKNLYKAVLEDIRILRHTSIPLKENTIQNINQIKFHVNSFKNLHWKKFWSKIFLPQHSVDFGRIAAGPVLGLGARHDIGQTLTDLPGHLAAVSTQDVDEIGSADASSVSDPGFVSVFHGKSP